MTLPGHQPNSTVLWAVFLSGGDMATAITPSVRYVGSGGVAEAPCRALIADRCDLMDDGTASSGGNPCSALRPAEALTYIDGSSCTLTSSRRQSHTGDPAMDGRRHGC
jgi:hypothetical protein